VLFSRLAVKRSGRTLQGSDVKGNIPGRGNEIGPDAILFNHNRMVYFPPERGHEQ